MPKPPNPMEILKHLKKTNCRDCGEATCLAFAAAVFQGGKRLDQCPHLEPETIERFGEAPGGRKTTDREREAALEQLKGKMASVDLASAARRLGAKFANNRLTVKVLGKDFSVDARGNLYSDIHIHPWVAVPVLHYILYGEGAPPSGKWVPLRELENGKDWYRLFGQRCEKPLKKVADSYPDLFADMLHIFNGRRVTNHYESDISLVLHPLPLAPVLICYWNPEDGLESDLHIFFDATAEKNLPIESIYALGVGLVMMFEKIALRHGLKQTPQR